MATSFQEKFFHTILNQFDKRSKAVEQLMELLGVGKDAIYRRFKAETPLTPDELVLLSQTFDISLDELVFEKKDVVPFVYNTFSEPILKFRDFLQEVYRNIQEIHILPDSQFYYTTAEIPVFHYLQFSELISFKMYVWSRTIWNFGDMDDRQFDFGVINEEDLSLAGDILQMYNDIPSTELWHLNIVDNTLNQIEYHLKIGGFRQPKDALVLCDSLLELVDHMRLMAQHGCKFKIGDKPPAKAGTNFDLYHNEMVSTSNTFLAITSLKKVVYSTYNTPDFLRCTDAKMCDYTEDWFNKIIGKSVSISTHAEKSRAWYFNHLRRKVELSRQRVINEIEEVSAGS